MILVVWPIQQLSSTNPLARIYLCWTKHLAGLWTQETKILWENGGEVGSGKVGVKRGIDKGPLW